MVEQCQCLRFGKTLQPARCVEEPILYYASSRSDPRSQTVYMGLMLFHVCHNRPLSGECLARCPMKRRFMVYVSMVLAHSSNLTLLARPVKPFCNVVQIAQRRIATLDSEAGQDFPPNTQQATRSDCFSREKQACRRRVV